MVMLPPGGGASEARAQQKAALAGFVHEASTAESLGSLISRLEKAAAEGGAAAAAPAALDEWALANLREASRDFSRASAVPKELAQRKASLESSAYAAWLEARSKSDFALFAPALKEWIELCKEVARAVDPGAPVYDVLLDEFEGLSKKKRVLTFIEEILGRSRPSFFFPAKTLQNSFPPPSPLSPPSPLLKNRQSVPPSSGSSKSSSASRQESSRSAGRSSRRAATRSLPLLRALAAAAGSGTLSIPKSRRSCAKNWRSTWASTSRRGGST